jgi:exopolyphosphatase/guanosine-5'-triphosphate,3'-diphosphate pyrophosphatase
MKDGPALAAVIDIGSSMVRLNLGQVKGNAVSILEYMETPLPLGHESFTDERISFETVEKLCDILKSHHRILRPYSVDEIRMVATTALREAQNRNYILDQIRIKTGLPVRVLEDSEEKEIIFRETMRRLQGAGTMPEAPALLAYIGTGSIGVSLLQEGLIHYFQNIRIGSLKLSELLGSLQERTVRFHAVLEEYMSAQIDMLRMALGETEIGAFIASGKEIELLSRLCDVKPEKGMTRLPLKALDDLWEQVKLLTPDQISDLYDLDLELSEIVLPSLTIYRSLLSHTGSDHILSPNVFLWDAMLNEMLFPKKRKEMDAFLYDSLLACARHLGQRYQYDEAHAAAVVDYSTILFDRVRKLHGLKKRERLLLQTAAVLHDIGKFVNLKFHSQHSYDLIHCFDLIGITGRELRIIANVARYHSQDVPAPSHEGYMELPESDRLLVSKLSAIIRLADALDRSHKQKFTDIHIKTKENRLIVSGVSAADTSLEEWTFGYKSDFFEEVYGIRPILIKKLPD